MLTIGYFRKSCGETANDATMISVEREESELADWRLRDVAQEVAEHAWHENDGWEWVDGATITLCYNGKELGDFKIAVECEPVFHAERM